MRALDMAGYDPVDGIWNEMKRRARVLDASVAESLDCEGPEAIVTRDIRINAWRHYTCFACAAASKSTAAGERQDLFQAVLRDDHICTVLPIIRDATVLAVGGVHVDSLSDMILNPYDSLVSLDRHVRACFEEKRHDGRERGGRGSIFARLASPGRPGAIQNCWVSCVSLF